MVSPTLRRYGLGFWKKTTNEFTRTAQSVLRLETLTVPTAPYPLLDYNDPQTATWMKVMTDQVAGGVSTAELTQAPASTDLNTLVETPTHVLFHGSISTKLPEKRPDIVRTGYAAFRNQDRGSSAFGKLYWDIDSYRYLALRVKSDGRRYFVNIQTESIVDTDIHQHRLYTRHHRGATTFPKPTQDPQTPGPSPKPQPEPHGQWETVLIPFNEFVRTNHGTVTEPQSEMLRQRLTTIGIGLTDRVPGPFSLAIAAMWATNLNERGYVDSNRDYDPLGGGDSDNIQTQGSARLSEVTEAKMLARAEERARMPERKKGMRDKLPDHFGKVGTGYAERHGSKRKTKTETEKEPETEKE